ncbi:SagB/ThcOx family dehydrogenase [bacterium]|nr:SagB/ThcOx family dehydrogenase [bacterium]
MTLNKQKQVGREMLKDTIRLQVDFSQTDQHRGFPPPPVQKPYDPEAERFTLTPLEEMAALVQMDLTTAIRNRVSRRGFLAEPLSLAELSYLLWATQGVRENRNSGSVLRTVPSAGCRHAFETYLCIFRVEGLKPGIYRYLPLEHQLLFEFEEAMLAEKTGRAALGQGFVGRAAVTFIWTAVPYRMEWRYGEAAYKVIALDAGHVCQNLYLACEAINAGTCAIAAYHQELLDSLLRVDGMDEFAVYLAPVGKVR